MMPKMKCKCDTILNYGKIPCPLEYCFISDVEYDKIDATIEWQELYARMNSFLKCPTCGRVWIFWDGFQECATEYIKAVD